MTKLNIQRSPSSRDDFLKNKEDYTEFAYEILNSLFEDEADRIMITGRNTQNLRHKLIDVMKCYAEAKGYSIQTIHLAVLFLDIYMDSYCLSVLEEHQKFVSLVILLLAAKIEENDEDIPSIKDLLHYVDLSDELGCNIHEIKNPSQKSIAYKSFSSLYCTLEFLVLKCLNFNAIRPTVMTFLNIFRGIAVTEIDMKNLRIGELGIETYDDLKSSTDHLLKMLGNVLLYEISFQLFSPSKVAAAMIGAARKILNLSSAWTLQLEFITQASLDDIEHIISMFFERVATAEFDNSSGEAGDSGYHSNNFESCTSNSVSFELDELDEQEDSIVQVQKKVKT